MKKILLLITLIVSISSFFMLTSCKSNSCKHTWVYVSDTSDCVNIGIRTFRCSKCNEEGTTIGILKDHKWSETSNTVTCTESGIITYTCKTCHKTKSESIQAKGHNYDNHDVCKNCGKYKYNIVLTDSLPYSVGYKKASSGDYTRAEIYSIEFLSSTINYLCVSVKAKKTYDWKGDLGTTAIAFKIKIVCKKNNEVVCVIDVFRAGYAVGQTVSFVKDDCVLNLDALSTTEEYLATIYDY